MVKGENKLILNQETMVEAAQEWLARRTAPGFPVATVIHVHAGAGAATNFGPFTVIIKHVDKK